MTGARDIVLAVRGLHVTFETARGSAEAVSGVDLELARGEMTALVGESGSGKTATALAIVGLLPASARCTVAGEILFDGRDLAHASEHDMQRVRGAGIGIVFQDPLTALNPTMRIGPQIAEVVSLHGLSTNAGARARVTPSQAHARALELLARVGLTDAERIARAYPHELSGGMRQRALIALAIAAGPRVLIADEPTTALDSVSRRRILGLIADLRAEFGLAVLLVTHDLSIAAEWADRTAVMYGGRVVEEGASRALFAAPAHPYTHGLVRSHPARVARGARLAPIPGVVPPATAWPSGCRFRTRCDRAQSDCAQRAPALAGRVEHRAACFHPLEELA